MSLEGATASFRPWRGSDKVTKGPAVLDLDIDFVFTRYRPPHFRGGIERYIHVVATELMNRGFQVRVTCFAENLAAISTISRNDIRVPRIPFLSTIAFALRSSCGWSRSSVVSVQYPQMGLGVPSDRLVVTAHTTSVGESASLLATDRTWMGKVRSVTRRQFGARIERHVFRKARRIIAINEHIADEIAEAADVPRENIIVIGNGVDCDFFSPSDRLREASGPLRVLYVGRLEPRKNVALLLDAVARAQVPLLLRIVGQGTEEQRLKQTVYRLGLGARVEFRGFRLEGDLLAEYRWADCFAMPSVYEGMPLTVLEARSCALPVIASPFAGAQTMITTGTGIVLQDSSADGMATALQEMARDRDRLYAMGLAARKDTLERYSWKRVADRLVDAYGLRHPPASQ